MTARETLLAEVERTWAAQAEAEAVNSPGENETPEYWRRVKAARTAAHEATVRLLQHDGLVPTVRGNGRRRR